MTSWSLIPIRIRQRCQNRKNLIEVIVWNLLWCPYHNEIPLFGFTSDWCWYQSNDGIILRDTRSIEGSFFIGNFFPPNVLIFGRPSTGYDYDCVLGSTWINSESIYHTFRKGFLYGTLEPWPVPLVSSGSIIPTGTILSLCPNQVIIDHKSRRCWTNVTFLKNSYSFQDQRVECHLWVLLDKVFLFVLLHRCHHVEINLWEE